jgi:hypothetical protein
MKMLADELTEMADYGYFIDIDNGTVLTQAIMDRSNYHYIEKFKPSTINHSKYTETSKTGLFCINTLCCIAVSFLFLKVWVFPPKN